MSPAGPPKSDKPRNDSIPCIEIIRGLAPLLVLWSHFEGEWPPARASPWFGGEVVKTYLTQPFGVLLDFGFVGVALFFLLSGFIITHVAQRENRAMFATKRILRIAPPLWAAVLLVAGIEALRGFVGLPFGPGLNAPITGPDVLASMGMVNLVRLNFATLEGVTWTLMIEAIFYLLCFAALGLMKSRPITAIATIAGTVVAVEMGYEHLSPDLMRIAVFASYVPYLTLGMAFYYLWRGRMRATVFMAVSGACWLCFFWSVRRTQPDFFTTNPAPGPSLAYAWLIFALALAMNERITAARPIRFLARISYSLYLIHLPVGFLVLDLTHRFRVPFTVGASAATAVSIGVAAVSNKFVEQPSQRLARRLVGARARAPEVTSDVLP